MIKALKAIAISIGNSIIGATCGLMVNSYSRPAEPQVMKGAGDDAGLNWMLAGIVVGMFVSVFIVRKIAK